MITIVHDYNVFFGLFVSNGKFQIARKASITEFVTKYTIIHQNMVNLQLQNVEFARTIKNFK